MEMTLTSFCGSILSRQTQNKNNIINYCKFQSLIKSLDQKGTGRMNTSGNETQISKAIRYSQYVRGYR